jgi:hypothetical protein
MMASVNDAIAELGIEIIHISGGRTGLTQPLDVGINKPFKSSMRVLWEEWMIDEIDRTGLVYAPTRKDISGWVAEVVWGLNGKNLMRNAWRKTGYDWFFEEGVGDVGDNGDDVIDDDNDGGDGTNFDEECDVANMLDDVLGLGEENSDNESDDDEMLWGERK